MEVVGHLENRFWQKAPLYLVFLRKNGLLEEHEHQEDVGNSTSLAEVMVGSHSSSGEGMGKFPGQMKREGVPLLG